MMSNPTSAVLKDVIAFVDVWSSSKTENYSKPFIKQLLEMGAEVSKTLNKQVTHVVFKHGRQSTWDKAKQLGVKLVSVLWVDRCKDSGKHVDEGSCPAIHEESVANKVPGKRTHRCMQPRDVPKMTPENNWRMKRKLDRMMKELVPSSPVLSDVSPFLIDEESAIVYSPSSRRADAMAQRLRQMKHSRENLSPTASQMTTSQSSPQFSFDEARLVQLPCTSFLQEDEESECDVSFSGLRTTFTLDGEEEQKQGSTPVPCEEKANLKNKRPSNSSVKSAHAQRNMPGLDALFAEEQGVRAAAKKPRSSAMTGKRRGRRTKDVILGEESHNQDVQTTLKSRDERRSPRLAPLGGRMRKGGSQTIQDPRDPALHVCGASLVAEADSDTKWRPTLPLKSALWPARSLGADAAGSPGTPARSSTADEEGVFEDYFSLANQPDQSGYGCTLPICLSPESEFVALPQLELEPTSRKRRRTKGSDRGRKRRQAPDSAASVILDGKLETPQSSLSGSSGHTASQSSGLTLLGPIAVCEGASEREEPCLLVSKEDGDLNVESCRAACVTDVSCNSSKMFSKRETQDRNGGLKAHEERKVRRTLVMTSMSSEKQSTVLQVVETLGGFSLADSVCESTTHVVTGSPRRTLNVLLGIARGCWILSFEWICRLQQHLSAGEHQQDLFSDQPAMFVSPHSQPPSLSLAELIRLCGGTVCRSVRQAGLLIGDYHGKKPAGARRLSEQWVLDCLTHLKQLPYDSYDLD
ncbi:microcephalin isoform X2 [Brienomyrus brachyistius]|uniref:microcephalin isoform X2 n=1 Tax=Brienomyrus brachyistius TaxID=42636 RepID=UPI0020B2AE9D|nr:microcephalin isoform X2 [Brienomyrus brachyistius]